MSECTIFEAISEGDVEGVEQMLRAEPRLMESRTPEGISPLMLAWYTFNPRMRALLREQDGDLDVFEAAMVGDMVRLTTLLDADPALVRVYSTDGFTLLHFAGFFNQPEVARALLDRGAPLDVLTRNDLATCRCTPLPRGARMTCAGCCWTLVPIQTRSSTAASRRCTRRRIMGTMNSSRCSSRTAPTQIFATMRERLRRR